MLWIIRLLREGPRASALDQAGTCAFLRTPPVRVLNNALVSCPLL